MQLPALLMQSILSAKPATSGYKGTHSLAKVVTSQLLTLCRGRDVSPETLSSVPEETSACNQARCRYT